MWLADVKKIEPSAWLKEAVAAQGPRFDAVRGAVATRFPHAHERIDAVRTVVATRLPQAQERLSSISTTVRCSPAPVLERAAEYYTTTVSLPGQTFRRVRTAGFELLESTTEAILDRILPADGASGDSEQSAEAESRNWRPYATALASMVPRAPQPPAVLRTFAVQLSQSAMLRVTVLCTRDACAAVMRRLSLPDTPQVLAEAHFAKIRQQLSQPWDGRSPISALKARLAQLGLYRLLNTRVLGHSAGAWLGVEPTASEADTNVESVIEALQISQRAEPESMMQLAPAPDRRDSGSSSPCSAGSYQVVVKNSFIEMVEPQHANRRMRRSVSCDLGFPQRWLGVSEPFPLEIDYSSDDSLAPFPASSGQPGSALIARCEDGGSSSSSSPACSDDEHSAANDHRTMLQLRHIPTGYTRELVVRLLNASGFAGRYDFVYVPVDFSSGDGLGYATVNLDSHAAARELQQRLQGFKDWGPGSSCACEVFWEEQKTLDELFERYRNSPVMHPSLPDGHRPALFDLGTGLRLPFPAPTREIRRPRIRHNKVANAVAAARLASAGASGPCDIRARPVRHSSAPTPLFLNGLV